MTVPREWVDELLQQVDLRRIVEQTGHVVTGRGDNLGIECPICHRDGQHCKLDVRKQLWHCFVYGASGNAIHWLRETQNVEFREAVRRLAELAGMTVPIEERSAGQAGDTHKRVDGSRPCTRGRWKNSRSLL